MFDFAGYGHDRGTLSEYHETVPGQEGAVRVPGEPEDEVFNGAWIGLGRRAARHRVEPHRGRGQQQGIPFEPIPGGVHEPQRLH